MKNTMNTTYTIENYEETRQSETQKTIESNIQELSNMTIETDGKNTILVTAMMLAEAAKKIS